MLNPEQQAQMIQDAYINDYFTNGKWSNKKPVADSSGKMIPAQFLINYMNKVMPQVRAGQGAT